MEANSISDRALCGWKAPRSTASKASRASWSSGKEAKETQTQPRTPNSPRHTQGKTLCLPAICNKNRQQNQVKYKSIAIFDFLICLMWVFSVPQIQAVPRSGAQNTQKKNKQTNKKQTKKQLKVQFFLLVTNFAEQTSEQPLSHTCHQWFVSVH